MNGRYLFRGKRLDNGEWVQGLRVHGDLIKEMSSGFILKTTDMSTDGIFECNVVRVDSATVGQCTGLKDKNGKLVFEGDIVKFKSRRYGSMIATVKWHFRGLTGYVLVFGDSILLMAESHNYEIIGNVYERTANNDENI